MHGLISHDIEEFLKRETIFIVLTGSTESHGEHLPMEMDAYESIDYSEENSKRAGVLCTALIWFGDSPQHMGHLGTISLRSELILGPVHP